MYARGTQLAAEQAAVDSPISPRKSPRAFDRAGEDGDGSSDNSVTNDGRGGAFAPTLGVVDQAFFFALMWGLGGALAGDPAFAFDVYVRDLVQVGGVA